MIIAVDFDGTLHDGEWPAIGEPLKDAIETMVRFSDAGCYIILNTCREGKELLEAINWMLGHRIPFNRVNDNHPEMIGQHGWNSRKVFANVYIDDKHVCGLPSWREIYKVVSCKWNGGNHEDEDDNVYP